MNSFREKHRAEKKEQWQQFVHSKTLLSVLILLAGFTVVFCVFALVAAPVQHDLRVGDIADVTITATKDIEDTVATQKLREAAAASIVEGMTRLDSSISMEADEELLSALNSITQARADFRQAAATPTPVPTPTPAPKEENEQENPEQEAQEPTPIPVPTAAPVPDSGLTVRQTQVVDELEEMIKDYGLTEGQVLTLLRSTESNFDTLCDTLLELSREAMQEGIREGQLASSLQTLHLRMLSRGISNDMIQPAYAILDRIVRENMFIDEDATEKEREKAAAAVEPVIYKKGQNIVQAGEIVTEQQMSMLSGLGLLSSTGVDSTMYIGMAVLSLLMLMLILSYLYQFERAMLRRPKEILLLTAIMLIHLGLCLLVRKINPYLVPIQMGTIIIAKLLRHRLALTYDLVAGVIIGVVSAGQNGILTYPMFQILLMSLFGGAAAVYLSRGAVRRSVLIYAGFAVALLNFVTMMAAGVLTSADIYSTFVSALYGAGGGLLSAILAVGVMPLLENIFNLVTPQMLLELSMPTQPLLKMLQTEASGTHHHSLVVANLAEAAADRVGANPLLCRVGAYYHDIGKTRRPIFFKENQIDQPNPHEGMEPAVSAAILAAHVRDGVTLARENKLPEPVVDLIAQHHGDGLMAYFYYAAEKAAEAAGKTVDTADYSYDGPKPQTKEAAILMMADTVEAATRTLKDRSRESMGELIRKLVKDKFESGQLDEAPLTFRDLTEISDAFIRTLTGIYHERIEYPDLKDLKKGE